MQINRSDKNPILLPSRQNTWESTAAFNGCVTKTNGTFHMLYRALSSTQIVNKNKLQLSSIGYSQSSDGENFSEHTQLFIPQESWEIYGCEDPRITFLDNKYYIFYTALSQFPFNANGIKVGLAITQDLKTITQKHPVTPFNAKAMSLFPEKINGKYAAILTANTDQPPAKISLALFDKEEEMWSNDYWQRWYRYLDDHAIPLQRADKDQVEIGAPPIKTDYGWLLIYAYIKDYFTDHKIFTIEAALLDLHNPKIILSRITTPLLQPETNYERFGYVPNIVFPSGAQIHNDELFVYYGAADTYTCLAKCSLSELLSELNDPKNKVEHVGEAVDISVRLHRYFENPILAPINDHEWENKAVFNPAVIKIQDKIHILYRAMSNNNVSNIGYAQTTDGYHIDQRLDKPVYVPREIFETNGSGNNFGCEDPRLTLIDERIYMCYTAYDGHNAPRVAFSSISLEDFLLQRWHWSIPKLISPPGIDDKDACVLPKTVGGKYMFFHRLQTFIWVDFVDDLHFYEGNYLGGSILLKSRPGQWDSHKVGIAAPPIETPDGWLLLYHGIGDDHYYRVGAVLLDLDNPKQILGRTTYPLLEPEMHNEKDGQIPNVVFPCGAVVKDDTLFVYYGGADSVTDVATVKMDKVLQLLKKSHL